MKVTACAIPEAGLLQAYAGVGANYTDCYETVLPEKVALPAFLQAFYTTWLFRLERSILMLLLRRRIPDAEVAALAQGGDSFAVWQVEARRDDQILLRGRSGHTCSFFAVEPLEKGGTRLLFGSAVVAREGRPLGWGAPPSCRCINSILSPCWRWPLASCAVRITAKEGDTHACL